ncbi:SecY-interacting protein [Serratia microhaemolytica]|uniref:SecY-interacting protein n=1 Tax=Serratia microhaemolytica TaxID=2675110 RepID=UPI000FDE7814|nr:SecY-interacting protein [Serratia microhaemolytica]
MEIHRLESLTQFTQRYVALWQQRYGHAPASHELSGLASPCIVENRDECVLWLPQPFLPAATLKQVETAFDIVLRPEGHAFYTQQYAGDMPAQFAGQDLTLLQVWSQQDFIRLQQNLIGHLVTQKARKLSPTLFLATVPAETAVISLCNISGNVLLEQLGSTQRQLLSPSLADFLLVLQPICPD